MIIQLSGGNFGGTEVEWISDKIVDNLEAMTMPDGSVYRLFKEGSIQAVLVFMPEILA